MAFLPNEIWIDAGECITWNSQTGEKHTVTFLQQPETPATTTTAPLFTVASSVVRPSFQAPPPFGCAGGHQGGSTTTASPATYDGAVITCVNSGPFCDDTRQFVQPPAASDACPSTSYTVAFPNAGNFKLVCLIHSDMTGVVHVLAAHTAYPNSQEFYDDEARDQAHDLINDADTPTEERNDFPRSEHEVIMTGELAATGGGKQYLAIMRYFPTTITVHVNDTVEWTNLSPDEPHTITFNVTPRAFLNLPPLAPFLHQAESWILLIPLRQEPIPTRMGHPLLADQGIAALTRG